MTATGPAPTVFVVDDDSAVLKSLGRLLREDGWQVEAFDSAEAFLSRADRPGPGCLLLDVNLPGLDGIELQRRLAQKGLALPVIFLTGHGDIPMSVRAIKAGAADFLAKPVAAQTLLGAVRAAIAQDALSRSADTEATSARERFASLTPRESAVLAALADGKLNKQIAVELGIVEQTVKFHRARIMQKLQARTVAELMLMVAKLPRGPGN